MKKIIIIILLFSLFSCKKEVLKPFGEVPQIEIIHLSSTSIKQFDENLILTIHYKDGDGDLGFENPDTKSVWVQDSRLPDPDWYFIPPLSPVGSNVAIEGDLEIKLNGTFLLGNGDEETTRFSIKIKDRAENWSNTLVTTEIKIVR